MLFCTFCGGENAEFPTEQVLGVLTDLSGTPEEVARRGITITVPDEWARAHPEVIEDMVRRSILHPMDGEYALKQGEAIFGFCTYDRLGEIGCPTLVMCGTDDILVPPGNSRILSERIPGAKLVEFPGGGHAFHTQFHSDVAAEVIRFLG